MARILILSSWVSRGHVGLSAAAPVLQILGHSVTQLPTVVMSNHPGWPRVAGDTVTVEMLQGMVETLAANGWLNEQDAFLTGYLPTEAHVCFAAELAARLRDRPSAPRIVVDPVFGDAPGGQYLPQEVAGALRDRLCPLADLTTPNLFELSWLTGRSLNGLTEAWHAAETLRKSLACAGVLVTSAPVGAGQTGLMECLPSSTQIYTTPCLDGVPHGVGDVLAALIAAGLPTGAALGHLQTLVAESVGAEYLQIAESAKTWTAAAPLYPAPLSEKE